jgi:hypothetical protein
LEAGRDGVAARWWAGLVGVGCGRGKAYLTTCPSVISNVLILDLRSGSWVAGV